MTDQPATNPVGHRWRPIEDLPDNWRNLVDTDLAYLVEYWNENREELASHGGSRTSTDGCNGSGRSKPG